MSMQRYKPTIIINPFIQEVELNDSNQVEGLRAEPEAVLSLNLHHFANILGALATLGVGKHTNREIALLSGVDTSPMKQRGEIINNWLPDYVTYDRGFTVLQDFSIAVALKQPGDDEILQAKRRALKIQRRQERIEERKQYITSLKEELTQLVAEATYTPEDIESLDAGKMNLYEYDSVRVAMDGTNDYVIALIDAEDLVCARILIEISKDKESSLDIYDYDGKAQTIWDAMPYKERAVFANTYRKTAPRTFLSMFTNVARDIVNHTELLDHKPTVKFRETIVRRMRRIETISILIEEPIDSDYIELSVEHYDKSDFKELRHRMWMKDKDRRSSIITELRSLRVYVEDHIRPVQQKAQLSYAPEDQIDMKPTLFELVSSILKGDKTELSQPEAVDVILAANNSRYYGAIDTINNNLDEPLSLERSLEILNDTAKKWIGDTYIGFAVKGHTVGRATIKKLHRR